MFKFLLKGALVIGAAGLILEGLKKLTEDKKTDEEDLVLDDLYEEEPEAYQPPVQETAPEEESLPAIAPEGEVNPVTEAPAKPEEVESVPAIAPVEQDLPAQSEEKPAAPEEEKPAEAAEIPETEEKPAEESEA
ncbi:hypothetical protein AAK899_09585 [Erysipelotrichaceae bacterium 51-3]|uniref:hypothetical protein n=1 Tax=Allobaculum sp. JKK-2023 TaxID=3108943 RepID=UPI002B05DA17|nr:hypothetical protein [Allobaculum sp. JKK-2023]